jgi:hypothetical protein
MSTVTPGEMISKEKPDNSGKKFSPQCSCGLYKELIIIIHINVDFPGSSVHLRENVKIVHRNYTLKR